MHRRFSKLTIDTVEGALLRRQQNIYPKRSPQTPGGNGPINRGQIDLSPIQSAKYCSPCDLDLLPSAHYHVRVHADSDAFQLEYNGSQSIYATVNGDTFLFEPRKVATKTQDSDIAIDRHPGGSAETFWHPHILDNEFLTICKQFTRSKACHSRHGACFKDFGWTKPLQNSYFDFMYLNHLKHNQHAYITRSIHTVFLPPQFYDLCKNAKTLKAKSVSLAKHLSWCNVKSTTT